MNKAKLNKKLIIIPIIAVILILLTVAAVFISRRFALKGALDSLDVTLVNTVGRVMELDGDNPDTVMTVIDAYIDASYHSDAARLLLYYIQYLDGDRDAAIEKLTACYKSLGADAEFLSQFKVPRFKAGEFEIVTECDGVAYGVGEGVYTSFFGGFAKAKISAILPRAMSAHSNGVYVIDRSDNLLKSISPDGSTVSVVSDAQMTEFVNISDKIYYIDINGVPHSPDGAIPPPDGQFAMNLRIEGDTVRCTLYDGNYNEIEDITL